MTDKTELKLMVAPIGWITDDHLTDKSATTYDKAVADRWCEKGWPVQALYDGATVRALSVENEALTARINDMHADRVEAVAEIVVQGLEADQLQAAIATPESVFINLKAGKIPKPSLRSMIDLYGEVVNGEDAQLLEIAKLRAERDQLKAENEALRDDIEQNQYDANAWRNSEESVWIEVFNSEGDDPFISAITGQITVEQLTLIQAEILEYREDYFEKGSGLYVFRCRHCQAHYDNVGMTEPAHWETDFELYSPFPWEEEAAAIGEGEQS